MACCGSKTGSSKATRTAFSSSRVSRPRQVNSGSISKLGRTSRVQTKTGI